MTEKIDISSNASKFPDSRIFLTSTARSEIFLAETGWKIAGKLRDPRLDLSKKIDNNITINFQPGDDSWKKAIVINNFTKEYFGYLFRTSLPSFGIKEKTITSISNKKYEWKYFSNLPMDDPLQIEDDGVISLTFREVITSDYFNIAPEKRKKMLEYLNFLDKVSDLIMKNLKITDWIGSVKTMNLSSSGVLTFELLSGAVKTVNMLDYYNIAKSSKTEFQRESLAKARAEREKFKESLNTESFFDGNLIATFVPYIAAGGQVAVEGANLLGRNISGYQGATGSMKNIKDVYTLKKLLVQTNKGPKTIDIEGVHGTKQAISENLFRELNKKGIFFDAISGKFTKPELDIIQSIKGKTLAEIETQLGKKITKQEYISAKKAVEQMEAEIIRSGKSLTKILNGLNSSIGKILLPVFFSEFHKHQNAISFAEGIAEWALFHSFAKAGAFAGKTLGTVGKITGPIIFGGLAIVGAKKGFELGGRIAFWETAGDKELGVYTKGKSAIIHTVTDFGVTEGLNFTNKVRKHFNDSKDSLDIGISADPENSWWPEMTIFQGKVNLGTSPWNWLGGAFFRNINDWNKNVDSFKIRSTEGIGRILRAYQSGAGVFGNKEKIEKFGSKQKLLAGILAQMLCADGGSNYFYTQLNSIIEAVVKEADKGKNMNIEKLESVVKNEISTMKIDSASNDIAGDQLILKKEGIKAKVEKLKNYISIDKFVYVQSILDRMIADDYIYKTGTARNNRYIQSQEEEWYREILFDKRATDLIDEKGKPIKVGEYFTLILDDMLEYKRENDFIGQIKKGNKKGIDWRL